MSFLIPRSLCICPQKPLLGHGPLRTRLRPHFDTWSTLDDLFAQPLAPLHPKTSGPLHTTLRRVRGEEHCKHGRLAHRWPLRHPGGRPRVRRIAVPTSGGLGSAMFKAELGRELIQHPGRCFGFAMDSLSPGVKDGFPEDYRAEIEVSRCCCYLR